MHKQSHDTERFPIDTLAEETKTTTMSSEDMQGVLRSFVLAEWKDEDWSRPEPINVYLALVFLPRWKKEEIELSFDRAWKSASACGMGKVDHGWHY